MPGLERYCRKCDKEIPHDGMTMYEGKEICECHKPKLSEKMYNINAKLSAFVHIQKIESKEEAERLLMRINREIGEWIKEVREMEDEGE